MIYFLRQERKKDKETKKPVSCHQEFQVPKMEVQKNCILPAILGGGQTPLTQTAYICEVSISEELEDFESRSWENFRRDRDSFYKKPDTWNLISTVNEVFFFPGQCDV